MCGFFCSFIIKERSDKTARDSIKIVAGTGWCVPVTSVGLWYAIITTCGMYYSIKNILTCVAVAVSPFCLFILMGRSNNSGGRRHKSSHLSTLDVNGAYGHQQSSCNSTLSYPPEISADDARAPLLVDSLASYRSSISGGEPRQWQSRTLSAAMRARKFVTQMIT